jgi:hypothetical protein
MEFVCEMRKSQVIHGITSFQEEAVEPLPAIERWWNLQEVEPRGWKFSH